MAAVTAPKIHIEDGQKEERKKERKRTKRLCKDIRTQMDFYFSDANLSKDRFLKKEIDKTKDGWLPISMFGNFNRMRKLSTDETLIARALSTSKLIEVSKDAKSIRRKIPIVEAKDVDERTIYVECLPPEVDHDWVKSVFAPYGNVLYVSLPRYQSTHDFKGFAFVEFDSVPAAEKAKEEMNNPPVSSGDKFGYFPRKGCYDLIKLRDKVNRIQEPTDGTMRKRTTSDPSSSDIQDAREAMKSRKRSRTVSEGDRSNSTAPVRTKKAKFESDDDDDDDEESDSNTKENETENAKISVSENQYKENQKRKLDSSEEVDNGDSSKKMKVGENREEKEGKKKKTRSKKNKDKNKKEDVAIPELRVLMKKEWLELRKEYIDLQKTNMRTLKETLQQYKQSETTEKSTTGDSDSKENGNDKTEEAMEDSEAKKGRPELVFIPNVIIRVESHIPMKRVDLKEKVKKFGEISYIEVENETLEGYIRCADEVTATKLADAHVANHVFTLVTGEAEKKYWEKLAADRDRKRTSKSKDKKRGKQKLEKKAEVVSQQVKERQRIVFDED